MLRNVTIYCEINEENRNWLWEENTKMATLHNCCRIDQSKNYNNDEHFTFKKSKLYLDYMKNYIKIIYGNNSKHKENKN